MNAPVIMSGLPAMVSRAASALASAKSAAEVLEARDIAGAAYDMAKRSARLSKAKGAHDELVAQAHRTQADALEIEAEAKRRLADEYDAAQERGEVSRQGQRTDLIPDGNKVPTVSDIPGLSSKDIHEARLIRDAEVAEPGIVRTTLDAALDAGHEPTRTRMREAVIEAAKRGLRGGGQRESRRNPIYTPPTPEWTAMLAVSGGCRRLMDEVGLVEPAVILAGFIDDAQRGRNLATIRRCRDFLTTILEAADAQ